MPPRPTIPADIDRRVRQAAGNRCGYCLSPQHLILAHLHIEHIIPLSKQSSSDESNLWLACPLCNGHKSDKTSALDPLTNTLVTLFHPRSMRWLEHFHWSEDGMRIVGTTATGRATVAALHLSDDPDALLVRRYWIAAGWHPPDV